MVETYRVRWADFFQEAVVEGLTTTSWELRETATRGPPSLEDPWCFWRQWLPWHISLLSLVLQCHCCCPIPFIQKITCALLTFTVMHKYLLTFWKWQWKKEETHLNVYSQHSPILTISSCTFSAKFRGDYVAHKLLCTYLPSLKSMAAILEQQTRHPWWRVWLNTRTIILIYMQISNTKLFVGFKQ